jgi:hypothetical protein
MRQFFKLTEDVYYPNRWYPGEILGIDNWDFTLPRAIAPEQAPFELAISKDGDQTDYSQAGSCAVHIGNSKVFNLLSEYKNVQLFPLNIKDRKYIGQYYAIKIMEYLDCLDEEKSVFQIYTENDSIRPDKAGEYHSIIKMRVDLQKIPENIHVFRLLKHKTTLIVSHHLKNSMEKSGITGARFKLV